MKLSRRKLMWIILAGVIVCCVVWYAKRWLDIDTCLDSGGRWNYRMSICEGSRHIEESVRVIQE